MREIELTINWPYCLFICAWFFVVFLVFFVFFACFLRFLCFFVTNWNFASDTDYIAYNAHCNYDTRR